MTQQSVDSPGFNNTTPSLILIVDDLAENLSILGNILRIEGYQLAIANNGKQAITIAASRKPDLILLDVAMPEMDGLTACRELKAREETKDIPVIFLTARTDTEDVVKGFDAGAVDYILKPFKATELLARVSTQLEVKQSRDLIVKQKAELAELLVTKDKLFSIVSHDLRSPFAGLLTLATMLVEDFESFSREEIFESVGLIRNTSDHLHSLIQNLFNWAKLQTHILSFSPVKLHLPQEVHKITDVLKLNSIKKDITIHQQIDNNIFVLGDADMLRIILHNLLVNAIKFSFKGGNIYIEAIQDQDVVTIYVKDEGTGMPPEKVKEIFEQGKTTSTSGTDNEPGTGLGLILCKEMAESMNGKFGLESVPGKGSTFWIKLPVNS
ncbi:MAG: hybrid sensor histidine kinase/response regulator [Lentimicrobium sp.]|jgi:signal transduction histidine kinase|nr:hybrid sensor histidine kinase/response regulator [Lentimicrobium sp.]